MFQGHSWQCSSSGSSSAILCTSDSVSHKYFPDWPRYSSSHKKYGLFPDKTHYLIGLHLFRFSLQGLLCERINYITLCLIWFSLYIIPLLHEHNTKECACNPQVSPFFVQTDFSKSCWLNWCKKWKTKWLNIPFRCFSLSQRDFAMS